RNPGHRLGEQGTGARLLEEDGEVFAGWRFAYPAYALGVAGRVRRSRHPAISIKNKTPPNAALVFSRLCLSL
ncbi:hypothetical protein ACVGWM_00105, partial [Enterobacter hormaechei]